MFITKSLNITEVPGTDLWKLNDHLVYQGRDHQFLVPAGFASDFATIPMFVQSLIPITGAHSKAAILHDFLLAGLRSHYRGISPHAPVSSVDADGIFRRTMRESGVKFVRRWLMWTGVRWGALFKPYRRAGWWQDGWKAILISIPAAPVFAVLLLVNGTLGLIERMLP
jgi:hypothetical protein